MTELTADYLREVLDYDPETGVCRWKKCFFSNRVGQRAGSVIDRPTGRHRTMRFFGRQYYEHRLIWLYVHGRWPTGEIDHINGDGTDNRLVNLREATKSQNMANAGHWGHNTTGFKGVTRSRGKWQARIGKAGRVFLGRFDSPQAAQAAYMAKARDLFGEFVREGKKEI